MSYIVEIRPEGAAPRYLSAAGKRIEFPGGSAPVSAALEALRAINLGGEFSVLPAKAVA